MTGRKMARAVWVSWILMGCGGGGSKPLTEDDFCTQVSEAECQVVDRCVTSADTCKAQRKAACLDFATAAKAGGVRAFIAGNVGACKDQTHSLYAQTAPITPTQAAALLDTCSYVFQGKVADLDTCTVKYDCANRSSICDKGRCAPKVVKGSGALCGNPGEICNTGLYCTTVSGASQCVAKGSSGATCDDQTPCLETLRCANGSCADRVAAAGACASSDDCVAAAPYCDPAAGNKCDPGLSFSASSPSCCAFGGDSTCSATGAGGAGGGGAGTAGTAGGTGGTGGTGAGGTAGGAGGASGAAGNDQDAATSD